MHISEYTWTPRIHTCTFAQPWNMLVSKDTFTPATHMCICLTCLHLNSHSPCTQLQAQRSPSSCPSMYVSSHPSTFDTHAHLRSLIMRSCTFQGIHARLAYIHTRTFRVICSALEHVGTQRHLSTLVTHAHLLSAFMRHTHFRIHTRISHTYTHILCNFFNPESCWYPEIKTTFVFYVIPVRQTIIGMSWHLTSLHFKSHSPSTQMHAPRSHSPCPQIHVHSLTHFPTCSCCILMHIDIFHALQNLQNLNTAQFCLLHCPLEQLETNWIVFWQF